MTIRKKIELMKFKTERWISVYDGNVNHGFFYSDMEIHSLGSFVPNELLDRELTNEFEYVKDGVKNILLRCE